MDIKKRRRVLMLWYVGVLVCSLVLLILASHTLHVLQTARPGFIGNQLLSLIIVDSLGVLSACILPVLWSISAVRIWRAVCVLSIGGLIVGMFWINIQTFIS